MNNRLKELRKDNNLSQCELGKKLFLSQYQISLLEMGKRNFTERTIEAICSLFKVNKQWFISGNGLKYSSLLDNSDSLDADVKYITELLHTLDSKDIDIIRKLALSLNQRTI